MRKAIVTICIGEEFEDISKITHSTLENYANKIDADFYKIEKCETTPHWAKFQIYELLNKYDRIIYLDTDLIVRDDCPDLFDIVPYNQIGAFNEARFASREFSFFETARAYSFDASKIWSGKYYNSGVMVISKCHKELFKKPEIEFCNFYEQSYLNVKFSSQEFKKDKKVDTPLMFDLSYKFNRMTCLDFCGIERYGSYIIHYAGYHYFTKPGEIIEIIKNDLNTWEKDKPNYKYKRKIVVIVSGGMGDQVNAEPTLRYLSKVYKNSTEIIISCHWPRLFKHLNYKIIEHSENIQTKPFYEIKTFNDPTTITYSVISNLLCHTIDYCSICALQRVLPLEDKISKLETIPEDDKELSTILNGFDLSKAVLVHPGRHWDSKSFPKKWWQEVVDEISKEYPVCLIGTDEHENRGAYQLNLPENSINLIDRTTVGTLISAISIAPILISNDSVPIHIAGAFDNWIVLIPTCKHPDHILPFRKDNEGKITNYYKAKALYKKLTLDDCDQRPTTWIDGGATAETKKDSWDCYIPEPLEVINNVFEILRNSH